MTVKKKRVDCIVGARPNFMKIAPIMKAFAESEMIEPRLIHTGQHYDVEMNSVFFDELGIPSPDLNLEIGSGTQTEQTAGVMIALEKALLDQRPDLLLVVGDVNSTVAAALVAAKLQIPLAHVEAGLRSFDLTMPEEINRLVTDRLSALLLTTEKQAEQQLMKEGVALEQIHFVGNVMIDTLLHNLDRAETPAVTMEKYGASQDFVSSASDRYAFVTLHRPSNVDEPNQLSELLHVLARVSEQIPIVFAVHPRTKARMEDAGLADVLRGPKVLMTPPIGYLEMLGLMQNAFVAITDSGGIQEETTALGVPCLTVRDNTERPITISEGTNTLVGSSADALLEAANKVLSGTSKRGNTPELWDGKASARITRILEDYLA